MVPKHIIQSVQQKVVFGSTKSFFRFNVSYHVLGKIGVKVKHKIAKFCVLGLLAINMALR